MQPMASALDGVKLVRGEVLDKSHLVNEVKFANKSAKDVRPDEVFFHKYFTTKAKGKKSAIVLEESSDDEESDEKEEMDLTGDEEAKNASSDEEEEELIWNVGIIPQFSCLSLLILTVGYESQHAEDRRR